MIKVPYKWFAFGLVAFAVALIYTVPAHLVPPYLPPNVQAVGVEGTVWRGQAESLTLENFNLGGMQWHIQPFNLLLGRLKAFVSFKQTGLRGQGDVIVKFDGLGFEDVQVTGDSEFLSPYIAAYGASINGPFKLNLNTLHASTEGLSEVRGHLIWQNALLTAPAELPLGDVEIELKQEGDIAIAKLTSNGEAINLDGQADLKPNWQYTSQLRFEPTVNTPDEVRQTLLIFGRPDARGAVTFSQAGALPVASILPLLNQQN